MTTNTSHDEVAKQALVVALSRELALENERMSQENEELEPFLDIFRNVELHLDENLVFDLGVDPGGDAIWDIDLTYRNIPAIPFNNLHKVKVSVSGYHLDNLNGQDRAWTPWLKIEHDPEGEWSKVVWVDIELTAHVSVVGSLGNHDMEKAEQMRRHFESCLESQGATDESTGQESLRAFQDVTFTMTRLKLVRSALTRTEESAPLRPDSHLYQFKDWFSLKNAFGLIRQETSSAWEEHKLLRIQNQFGRVARDSLQTISLSFRERDSTEGVMKFRLEEGAVDYTPKGDPLWTISPSDADTRWIPLRSLPRMNIMVAGIDCRDPRLETPRHHIGPIGPIFVEYTPHIKICFTLGPETGTLINSQSLLNSLIDRIHMELTGAGGFADVTPEVTMVTILTVAVQIGWIGHVLELLGHDADVEKREPMSEDEFMAALME